MKRSPLKRTGRLPHRRAKPRPGTNIALRRAYKLANGACELTPLFPADYLPTEGGLQALVPWDGEPLDLHHVLPGRKDLWSNFIRVRRQIHTPWGHNYRQDLTVICLAIKARKDELNVEELESCLKPGVRLRDWVEALLPRLKFSISRKCHADLTQRLGAA
jgi:hypothetical protein